MLESLVARVLNSLLGKYVEELDTEGLNVGIFGGDVTLRDLKLKPSCLFELELPIEVVSGSIGELKLTIPWNYLTARPVIATIQDVMIICCPVGLTPYDENREKQLQRALKARLLERIEAEGGFGLFDAFHNIAPILTHTVELHVRNVHVRYEDIQNGVAAGIFLQDFSVETTNNKWKPVNEQSGNCSYQLVRAEAFSFYFNVGLTANQMIVSDPSCEWAQCMRTALLQFQVMGCPLDFVLKPLNLKLKMIAGRGGIVDPAPLLVDVVVQDVVIVFSYRQLKAVKDVMEHFDRIPNQRENLAVRPHGSVKGNLKAWWLYAYSATIRQRVRPYTWSKLMSFRKIIREYKNLFKETLLRPGDLELRLDLQRAEDNLSISSIIVAREHAKLELRRENSDAVEIEEVKSGSGLFRLVSRRRNAETATRIFSEYKLNLTVDNLSGSLIRDGCEMFQAHMTQCLCSLQWRANGYQKMSARAANILVEGAAPDELMPILSTTYNNHAGNTPNVCFSLDIEMSPRGENEMVDYGITLSLMPMEFVYQEYSASEFLRWTTGYDWKNFLWGYWIKTKEFISGNMTRHPRVDLHTSICLPRIVIPESGSLQKGGLILVVDLGKWDIKTELQKALSLEEAGDMTHMELDERLYHRLLIQCTAVQALFLDSGEEWREIAKSSESEAHLFSLSKASATLSLSIKPDYRTLPSMKLNLATPAIRISLAERRVQQLFDALEAIPRPNAPHIMFHPQPPLDPKDRIPTVFTVSELITLTHKIVEFELSRQRTPDASEKGLFSPDYDGRRNLGCATRSIVSESSDEEFELWARTVDLPGFEDNVSPNNNITILFRLTITELTLHLPRYVAYQEKPYVMMRLSRFSLDVAIMEYGPAIQLTIGGLQLIDKLHISPSGEYLEVLSTQSDQDCISLLYRKVRAICPDFKTHFHGVEQSIVVDVGHFSLVLQREASQSMNKYLTAFFSRIRGASCCNIVKDGIGHIIELWQSNANNDPPVPQGGTKYSFSMHVMDLNLRLREIDMDLLQIYAGGLSADFALLANERFIFRTSLQKLSMDDLSEASLYPKVITQDEDFIFEMKFVTNKLNYSSSSQSNTSLKISLARLHIFVGVHIIITLQRFAEFLDGFFLKFVKASIENFFRPLVKFQYPLRLSISLRLPTLMVMPGPTAPSLFIMNLGDLTIENLIKYNISPRIGGENILIELKNSFISRGLLTLAGSLEVREEVIESLGLKVDIKNLVDTLEITVECNLRALKFDLSQKDIHIVMMLVSTYGFLFNIVADKYRTMRNQQNQTVSLKSLQNFFRYENEQKPEKSLRLCIDSMTVTLFKDQDEVLSSPVRDLTNALCKFELDEIILNVVLRVNGEWQMNLTVNSCTLDDIRSDPNVNIKRVFGALVESEKENCAFSVSSPPLLTIQCKQSNEGDSCIDVFMEQTRLNLSASFLAALFCFFMETFPEGREGGFDNLGYVRDQYKSDVLCCNEHTGSEMGQKKGFSMSLRLKRPEVALATSKGLGLVAHCELLVDWSHSSGREETVLALAGLQIFSIQPAPMVLNSCDVQIVRNVTDVGTQINAALPSLELNLCSTLYQTFSDIVDEVKSAVWEKQPMTPKGREIYEDDLWSPKKIAVCCGVPFSGAVTEIATNEPHSFPVGSPAESLVLEIGNINVSIGLQHNLICYPLFVANASLKVQAHDWSSALSAKGEINIEVACWNDKLEVWEPLLESWGINFDLYQSKALPISPCAARPAPKRPSQETTRQDKNSESSGDESDTGMAFLKPDNFNFRHEMQRLSEGISDCSDSELDDGILERLQSDISHLFVNDRESSGGEGSSDEEETESGSSETCRSPATERAVFLNKHVDSEDSGLDTEAVDRLATYLLIEATRRFEMSITPNTISNIERMRAQPLCSTPHLLANHLGPSTIVSLRQNGVSVATSQYDDDDSAPSTPGTPSPPVSPSKHGLSCDGRNNPNFSYTRPDVDKLTQEMFSTEMTMTIPNMDPLNISVGRIVGNKSYPLNPIKHGCQYSVIVSIDRQAGNTNYIVSSPLQLKNDTSYAIGIYYRKSTLENLSEDIIGTSSNPFDEMIRLAVVAPDDRYYVPLTVCFHSRLHFLPIHLIDHGISEEGISWQEMLAHSDDVRDIVCSGTDGSIFSMKMSWSGVSGLNRTLTFTSPWLFRNLLPCAMQAVLPSSQSVRLEAGEEINVYSIHPKESATVVIEVPQYMGLPWSGSFAIGPDCKEKTVSMTTEQDTDGGNKHLALSVRVVREDTAAVLFYAPYWLINKTGLPLQIRGSGSDVVQEWTSTGPLFFCFWKQRARTVRLRVLSSSWSPAFSLDPVGCAGLVVCRDKERKKRYRVVVDCQPSQSHPALCNIITFQPHLLVENACKKHLRIMEDNERADLWHDIAAGQSLPFWPDTESLRMVVRLRDSKHVSPPFPVNKPHITALRMDKGCALTVEVTAAESGLLKVLLRHYRSGDAPVRIDNQCADVFLKLRQRGCPQVALISPYHSLLYTWDDACKERELLWSVYNNSGQEQRVQLERDASGEERVSFRSVRNQQTQPQSPSSASSDSDHDPLPNTVQVLKETRKDTVVVYWTSFLQGQQRVLLLTQEERLASRARRSVEAERSGLELFVAFSGFGLSLLHEASDDKMRELAYISINPPPAVWELSMAQHWKSVTADLASWLETNYIHGVMQPTIKDYINVDFKKMQMNKPIFGALRRQQRPSLWLQYRASRTLWVLQAILHRIQIDDQRSKASKPCVLTAAPNSNVKPAFEVSMLCRHNISSKDVIKFNSLTIQEHFIHLDCDWLLEVCKVAKGLISHRDLQSLMRCDIARLHAQIPNRSTFLQGEVKELMVEELHCMDVALELTLVPSSSLNKLSAANALQPVPDVLAGLVLAVAVAPAPIANLPIKLSGVNMVGRLILANQLVNSLVDNYVTQLMQQLHVLVRGTHVLATRVSSLQENVVLPEEFSETVRLEVEERLSEISRDAILRAEPDLPRALWLASRAFPLGCALGLSGLSVSLPRGPPSNGLDAYCRGPGRSTAALLASLVSDSDANIPDALLLLEDSIARSSLLGEHVLCRARPPRMINKIWGLRPFSMVDAQGMALLDTLGHGQYNTDDYWGHSPLTPSHSSILLVTLQHVLLVDQVGKSSTLTVTWATKTQFIHQINLSDLSIVVKFQQGMEVSDRIIPCWDPDVLNYTHTLISQAMTFTKV